MILFPAIDVLDNKAVRLLYGKRDEVTIYGNPIEMAEKWESYGAEYLHIVDLNGAFDDSLINSKTLKQVISHINIPMQIGGGIKSLDKIKYYLEEVGATRVILGTACVNNPKLIEDACSKYGNKIVAGIDVKDGYVAIKGWVEKSNLKAIDVAINMRNRGIDTIVYTDISRDGSLCGVNLKSTLELSNDSGMNIIASGGMSKIEDLIALKDKGIYGAILGRAIYTGNIDLKEALKI